MSAPSLDLVIVDAGFIVSEGLGLPMEAMGGVLAPNAAMIRMKCFAECLKLDVRMFARVEMRPH